jgi:pimeloyl-ACP methyl ester carboxylesterase
MSHPEHPSDPPTELLRLPAGPVGYTDQGDGPTLLAVHGGPGSVRDWRWLGPVLEPHLRLVRLDMPGFAGTPLALCPDPSAAARARFVVEAADAMGIERFAVLGHSIGGSVALEVAAQFPDRVTGIALAASVGLRIHRMRRRIRGLPAIVAALRAPGVGRALRPVLRRSWAGAGFPRSTPDEEKIVTLDLLAAQDFAANAAAAARVTAPAFVAWSRDDPMIEGPIFEELGAGLPPGPRIGFEEGGHNLATRWSGLLRRAWTATRNQRPGPRSGVMIGGTTPGMRHVNV